MKKKVYRERYAKNVISVQTFDKHVESPELEVRPTKKKKRASKKKEA